MCRDLAQQRVAAMVPGEQQQHVKDHLLQLMDAHVDACLAFLQAQESGKQAELTATDAVIILCSLIQVRCTANVLQCVRCMSVMPCRRSPRLYFTRSFLKLRSLFCLLIHTLLRSHLKTLILGG